MPSITSQSELCDAFMQHLTTSAVNVFSQVRFKHGSIASKCLVTRRLPVLFTSKGTYRRERQGTSRCCVCATAGQMRKSPFSFSSIGDTSPLLWLARQYAILDGPTMPIVAEGDEEPNNTYVEQLTASARAAVQVALLPLCLHCLSTSLVLISLLYKA